MSYKAMHRKCDSIDEMLLVEPPVLGLLAGVMASIMEIQIPYYANSDTIIFEALFRWICLGENLSYFPIGFLFWVFH